MERIQCAVIGAGAVGLGAARALALQGMEVVVIERNLRIGEEASSRNNEVIHAGFLYGRDSLKAALCKRGAERLYQYCAERGIGHRRIGKLMPAVTGEEVALLERLVEQGSACALTELRLMRPDEARSLEPQLQCTAALYSPSTGIVDSHALMVAYQADAEREGASVAFGSRVAGGRIINGEGFVIDVETAGAGSYALHCDVLVNAAGPGARAFALRLEGFPAALVPDIYEAKGCYYALAGKAPFRHLIVPMGETRALGGAFTLDLAGNGRFGPDLEWVSGGDYSVAPDRAAQFSLAIRRYFPSFDETRIHPSYSGIRLRTTGPGEPLGDWVVLGPKAHRIPGLVHLLAMESPGLTCSLVLGEYVGSLLVGEEVPA